VRPKELERKLGCWGGWILLRLYLIAHSLVRLQHFFDCRRAFEI
jgi:hypothetical protein